MIQEVEDISKSRGGIEIKDKIDLILQAFQSWPTSQPASHMWSGLIICNNIYIVRDREREREREREHGVLPMGPAKGGTKRRERNGRGAHSTAHAHAVLPKPNPLSIRFLIDLTLTQTQTHPHTITNIPRKLKPNHKKTHSQLSSYPCLLTLAALHVFFFLPKKRAS
jgi:hypothetical protein